MFIDRKTIKENMIKVLQYSQEETTEINPKVMDMYMRLWELGKADFIKIFGGTRLVFPEELHIHLSEEVKEGKAASCLDRLGSYINIKFRTDYRRFCRILSTENFFNNYVSEDFEMSSTGKIISKGTKISKALKHFITDPFVLRSAQDLYSEYIQQNNIRGYLVFSVDPLDFLSLSENTYNWRSCLNLQGEYRAGTLGYMTDYSTVVVYITTDEPTNKLPHFPDDVPWNSKKLRFLLHFNNDLTAVAMDKIYPFDSKELAEITWEKIRELLPPSTNCWEYPTWAEDGRFLFDEKISYYEQDDFRGFNDIATNNTKLYRFNHKKIYIHDICVGEATYCLKCGGRVYDSDTMYCFDCNNMIYCDYCHEKYPKEECCTADGDWICPNCFSNYYAVCRECGKIVPIDDFDFDRDMCCDCADGYDFCTHCGEIHEIDELRDGLCEYCYALLHEEKEVVHAQ